MRAIQLLSVALALGGCRPEAARGEDPAGVQLASGKADSAWQWVYVPNAYQFTYGTSVAADTGGAYVTGDFDRGFNHDGPDPSWGTQRLELRDEVNFVIARHAADGTLKWARRYGDGGRVTSSGIALGPDRSLFVAGTIGPSIAHGAPGRWNVGADTLTVSAQSAFLARLDTTGAVQWATLVDGAADVSEVAVDGGGRVYVAGSTGVWDSNPLGHAFVAAYSQQGKRLWLRDVTKGVGSKAEGIATTPYGVCVVGQLATPDEMTFNGEHRHFTFAHAFAAGVSRDGALLWNDTLTATHRDPAKPTRAVGGGPQTISAMLNSAAADASGACYAAGAFAGVLRVASDVLTSEYDPVGGDVPHGYTDVLVVKYDRTGHALWARRGVGASVSDAANAIAVDPQGRVVVAGDFMGAGDFGRFPLTAVVTTSAFVPGREPTRAVFIANLLPNGDVARVAQNAPLTRGTPTGIAVARDGSVYVIGTQEGNARYGSLDAPTQGINAFLARLRVH